MLNRRILSRAEAPLSGIAPEAGRRPGCFAYFGGLLHIDGARRRRARRRFTSRPSSLRVKEVLLRFPR
jgi:hypothetical protein